MKPISADSKLKRALDIAECFKISTGINCSAMSNETDENADFSFCQNPFCVQLQNITGQTVSCDSVNTYAAYKSNDLGGQYIYMCPNGLCHFIAPIKQDGKLAGMLLAGPVLINDADDYMSEIKEEYKVSDENMQQLYKYFDSISVVSPRKVKYLADTLSIMADSVNGEFKIEESKELLQQQSDISAVIHDFKRYKIFESYPIEKEDQLFALIENGDSAGAKKVLNELLGIIYFSSGQELDIIKARVTELVVLLSRSAMRGGANSETIFGMSYHYINEIASFTSIEQLSRWLTGVMNKFTERVIDSSFKKSGALAPALKYIHLHYQEPLMLEDVASKAFLTPVYFSRLFKANMGVNFTDYVNKLRVDLACKLLLNNDITLVEIAQLCGFNDQSYFSKIFKNIVGISPKKYKNEKGKIIKEAIAL